MAHRSSLQLSPAAPYELKERNTAKHSHARIILMLNVLVIDDNVQLQIVFRKVLRVAGYAVQLASDGEKDVRMAFDNTPDIIVLDILLPKVGGIEVLRA